MSRRVAIPAIQGIKDDAVAKILAAVKERIENLGGERVGMSPLAPLGAAATNDDIINKLNEIVARVNG